MNLIEQLEKHEDIEEDRVVLSCVNIPDADFDWWRNVEYLRTPEKNYHHYDHLHCSLKDNIFPHVSSDQTLESRVWLSFQKFICRWLSS